MERNLLIWQHGNIPAPLSITAPINGDRIQFMYIVYKTKNHDATGFLLKLFCPQNAPNDRDGPVGESTPTDVRASGRDRLHLNHHCKNASTSWLDIWFNHCCILQPIKLEGDDD
ncbi:MAG: hypothetical protein AXW12_10680 [Thalassospira sp. Nap_22]|nr:MAG: hypothetical protein AXW12_10680 [Thalassospira sp. Nap_22]